MWINNMTLRRKIGLGILLILVTATAGIALSHKPTIATITPPESFPTDLITQGAALAAIGDCAVCHTATHGQAFAGGRPLPTPFGTIYATNITPDPETGIGTWSEEAFRRAMRDGIDREGRRLYPAFPYPHFTRATDQDIGAIYAFLMTREPIKAKAPRNGLPFPLNVRATVASWDLLFLRPGVWQPDPAQDAEWNRGAYLADGVGHCGACHTAHNLLGAERQSQFLAGGEAEGWDAPPLRSDSPSGAPWSIDDLTAYLRTGFAAGHGVAAGPMRAVSEELASVPDQDVRAIAVYVASLMPKVPPTASPPLAKIGENAVFTGACGGCHAPEAPMMSSGAPSLALSTVVNAPSSRDTVQMILYGIPWREGHAGPYMPGFAAILSDEQIVDLVRYLRARFSGGPAWSDIESQVKSARREGNI
jgi:mono/diheme cytochrome c family protein